jgi:hypothetical protein|tara:strand:- start:105 stop:356 length:252 start_codon:yes stop_codon:yes gene_type:complete
LGSVSVHIGKIIVKKDNEENMQMFFIAPLSIGDRNSEYDNDISARSDIPRSTEFPIESIFLAKKNAYILNEKSRLACIAEINL